MIGKYLLNIAFLCFLSSAFASPSQNDTTQLSFTAFLHAVYHYHPLTKQARLQKDFAEAEMRLARGGFDPKIDANWDTKNFKNTEYYNIFSASVKVPTMIPVDPKFEVSRNRGDFLNRERFISEETDYTQFAAGLSLPLGRGLFTDARRTVYRQAEVFQDLSKAEQTKMINETLLDVSIDYWNWYYSYHQMSIIAQSLSISEEVFRRVRLDYDYGEASGMDTIQAMINKQTLLLELQIAQNEWIQDRLLLSTHIWDEKGDPLELKEMTIPEPWFDEQLDLSSLKIDNFLANVERHPELLKLTYKEQHLTLENRLNKENLKPQVDLNYNFINSPIDTQGDVVTPSFLENYKFGLGFNFPLFLRKERAKVLKTDLKILTNQYEIENKRRTILAKINTQYQQLVNARGIVEQSNSLARNYERLLNAEFVNLEVGESDLFKINVQQSKYLQAQRKLLKSQAAFQKNKAYLYYAAGLNLLTQ